MLSRCVVSQVKHNSYFLIGLALGLWLALATVPLEEETAECLVAPVPTDEYEPQREQRAMGAPGAPGRSVQRPRYYSTELGMRAGLLAGALSSEDALGGRAAALNRTAARLQPALRFFITASALRTAPAGANVVGFTDTREMLKPFHALKYLADNYLEEYDFFFLVTDSTFVNAQRLTDLVARLSVSQDVYMGTVAEDETQYCSLDHGILLSNSVLRAVHGELDWCVRNSYSPHHHENIGRCVLHAAHKSCTTTMQGESYVSWRLTEGVGNLAPGLADAVTAHPVHDPQHFYQLHAYVSRVLLQRAHEEVDRMGARMAASARRHPRGYRNVTWPSGLRADPGLAPQQPANRFDHLRWTTFNATHAFMPDDHRMVAPITGAMRKAIDLVLSETRAWALTRWGAGGASLLEGSWCFEPPYALRYRLLLRLQAVDENQGVGVRQVEVVRPLGAARLVPARYVTESARVQLLLPLASTHVTDTLSFLQRYDQVCVQKDKNTALIVVMALRNDSAAFEPVRSAIKALREKNRSASIQVVEESLSTPTPVDPTAEVEPTWEEMLEAAQALALIAGLPHASPDSLILLSAPHMEFNEDFLNRVRMNTISGEQWFLPIAFARYSQYLHPRFLDADGARPQQNTGRFNYQRDHVLGFYRQDYEDALSSWTKTQGSPARPSAILARSPLRVVRAPEPALLLAPRSAPCPATDPNRAACLQRVRERDLLVLDLGARHALAKLLLETQAELE